MFPVKNYSGRQINTHSQKFLQVCSTPNGTGCSKCFRSLWHFMDYKFWISRYICCFLFVFYIFVLCVFYLDFFFCLAHSCAEVTQQARAASRHARKQKPAREKNINNKKNILVKIKPGDSLQTCPARR